MRRLKKLIGTLVSVNLSTISWIAGGTPMKARFWQRPSEVVKFLADQDFPFTWTIEGLDGCIILAVVNDLDAIVGYVWFNWLEGSPGVLELHACIHRDHHGRWLTRQLIRDLYSCARLCNAHTVVGLAVIPSIERMYLKAGFDLEHPFAIKTIKENKKKNNGISQTT
jgi:GNAT superfamily N-acetyltransferase